MEKVSFRFKREEHLKGRSRIRETFGKGKRYFESGLRLFVFKNNLSYNRICFSFASGRKFGNAVARNRAKRLCREAYRLIKERLICGYDLILMIHQAPNKASLSERMEQLESLFKKAGIME